MAARVAAAFACGGPDATYLPTGGIGRYGPSEASIMAADLCARGVPAERILIEETALNTFSSACAVARMLAGWNGPVRAASSAYHLPRCILLLRLAGVRAIACPPPPPARHRVYWAARECIALPCDALLMTQRLWRPTGR